MEKLSDQILTRNLNIHKGDRRSCIDGVIGDVSGAAVVLAATVSFALLANISRSTGGIVASSIVAGVLGLALVPIMWDCWSCAAEAQRHAKKADECETEIKRRAAEKTSI